MVDRMKKKVEVLAPAGSFESMKAAIAAGADAVYMGGSRFGARAYAENPEEEQFLEAIDYAHLHGCRLYMTVNTLVKDGELEALEPYLLPYYRRGLDAAIVQDMGVFSLLRERFPDLPVHASTQMTVTGPQGAALMTRMGASRIVLARECSLEEIRAVYEETGAELECFVHGALCYCYSGQCLFSSLIGGRSGNRGRCAQTCRLPFDVLPGPGKESRPARGRKGPGGRYVLSLKDLCTLDLLPELIDAGAYSLKIEGRMKSPRYTAGVVRIYRKYVDRYLQEGRENYRVEEADRRELLDLFDRGGQTDGYLKRGNGREMVVLKEKPAFREENRELTRFLDEAYVKKTLREPVRGRAVIREGEPALLELTAADRLSGRVCRVRAEGEPVQAATGRPLTADRIREQLARAGGTPFSFESLDVEAGDAPFVPIGQLNELRREALERLEEALLSPYRREGEKETEPVKAGSKEAAAAFENAAGSGREPMRLTVLLERRETLSAALAVPEVSAVYLDSAGFAPERWEEDVRRCHGAGKSAWLAFPVIFREPARAWYRENRERIRTAGFDGLLLRSWEELPLACADFPDLFAMADFNLYTMNRRAEAFARGMAPGLSLRFALPVELNARELARRGCAGAELLAYGRLPVMVSAQCVKQTADRCGGTPGLLVLRDRKGKDFPVKNQCRFCYNVIYNSAPLSLLGEKKQIEALAPGSLRLSFTTEGEEEVRRITGAFAGTFWRGKRGEPSGDYTKGHFSRGVE